MLLPREIKMELTLDEYVNYVLSLRKYNEVDLLYKCLLSNRSSFVIPEDLIKNHSKPAKEPTMRSSSVKRFSHLSKELQDILYDIEDEKENMKINLNEYLEDLRPKINLLSTQERKPIRIFQYIQIVTLKAGDAFGDVALSNPNQKRYYRI